MRTPFQLHAELRTPAADRAGRESLATGTEGWRPKLNDTLPLRMLLTVLVNSAAQDSRWPAPGGTYVLCHHR